MTAAERMLAPMGGRLVSPTFVGRRDALAAAAGMLRRTRAGRASHLLVAGEAGIGKTRLAEAVSESAQVDGFHVLRGGCLRLGSGELPYRPIGEVLRGIERDLDPDELAVVVGDDGPVLGRIAPALGRRDPRAIDPEAPSELARSRLFDAILAALQRLSGLAPVLLVVEDLHWADQASLDVLSSLLRSRHDARIAALLTFRSDELHRRHPLRPWLGEMQRLDALERIDLGPFSVEETRELIAAITGVDPGDEVPGEVQRRADGNPLFIEELLARQGAGRGAPGLPPTLRDILRARAASVPDDAQAVLAVAAVADRPLDADMLVRVSGLPVGAADAALEAALDRGLLVAAGDAPDRLVFRHALVQEVVYDDLLPGERVRLHGAFAAELASSIPRSREPGRWAELAAHWDAARDEPRTLAAAVRAAEEAERAFAFDAALARYRRALTAWDLVVDPAAIAGLDRIEILARAASVAALAGDGGTVALLREGIAEADRLGDAARGSVLRGRLGHALWLGGDPAGAEAAYGEALTRMPPGPPTMERAQLLARIAQSLMLGGRDLESIRLAESAVAMAREVGDRRIEGQALNTLGSSLTYHGRSDLGAEYLERSLAISLDVGDPDDIARAYLNVVESLADSGREERALDLAGEGIERARSMSVEATYGTFLAYRIAAILYDLGRWDEAARIVAEWRLEVPGPDAEVYFLARIVEALVITVQLGVATGDWESATTTLTGVGGIIGRFAPEYQYTGPYRSALAELALWQRRPGDALAAVEAGLDALGATDDARFGSRLLRLGLRAAADLAEIARDRRDVTAEAEAVRVATALRAGTDPERSTGGDADGALAAEIAAEVAGAAAEETRLLGAGDPAAWRESVTRWQARGRPYPAAYARWREAEASLANGDRAGATVALAEAYATAVRLGARPLSEAISSLARRARLPLRPPGGGERIGTRPEETAPARSAAAGLGLTPRECEVLELVAQGMTNRQIAEALYISVYTAGVHVSRILGKLGATSRTEAAGIAYRLGIVER